MRRVFPKARFSALFMTFSNGPVSRWKCRKCCPTGRTSSPKIPGADPERRLLFEAHVDTAGVEKMTVSPFEPVISDGRLYGRGACDNKGGLAAMMHALANIKRSGTVPACDVWLAATIDEEHSYRGVLGLCEGLRATGAVVAEPTGMRLVVASKGCLRWRIVVKGRAAHSSKPHLGVSAITPMAGLIVALEEEAQELALAQHPLVGTPDPQCGRDPGRRAGEYCSRRVLHRDRPAVDSRRGHSRGRGPLQTPASES